MANKKRFESMKGELLEGLSSLDNKLENNNTSSNRTSKNKNIKKKKVVNNIRIKRSYMLTDEQIEMVILLKAKLMDKDYSDIVGTAIEKYYRDIMGG